MSELNIREKWVYTQRQENERKFLASDMAAALGITAPCFYSLRLTYFPNVIPACFEEAD